MAWNIAVKSTFTLDVESRQLSHLAQKTVTTVDTWIVTKKKKLRCRRLHIKSEGHSGWKVEAPVHCLTDSTEMLHQMCVVMPTVRNGRHRRGLLNPLHWGHEGHVPFNNKSQCTHSQCLVRLVHGNAVHADLNGVSCRSVSWTVAEVQFYRLNCVDRRSETPKGEKAFVSSTTSIFCFCTAKLLVGIDLLIQHVEQLVDHVLTEKVSCLWGLVLWHGGEKGAVSPGQTRWVPQATRSQMHRH